MLAASVAVALVLIGIVVTPSAAQAAGPTTFSNTASIAIPAAGSADQIGTASPYPSDIVVSGMPGSVTKVQVVFNGLTHASLNDVDAMVVAPSGQSLVVLSDVADPESTIAFASNATLTFDDTAAGAVPTGNVPTGTYRPTNNGGGDAFPAPAPVPSAQTTLAGAFTGINPNGTWRLFLVDDATGDLGTMAGGWSLVITTEEAAVPTVTTVTTSGSPSATGTPVTFTATVTAAGSPVTAGTVSFSVDGAPQGAPVAVNASGTATFTTSALAEGTHLVTATYSGSTGFLTSNGSLSQRVDNATVVTGNTFCNPGAVTVPGAGAAVPYPSNITVSGLAGPVAKVTATLSGLSHTAPIDLDVLLSGPTGANVVLMSDVGGTTPVSGTTVTFDDTGAPVPTPLVSGTFRPTDDDSDVPDAGFPAPAPIPSTATALATFDGTNANGMWSLWVVDDATGDAGSIAGGWCLTITTTTPTTTTITSSVNPSTFGDPVTFTATVTAAGSTVTTGTVLFSQGGTPLADVAVGPTGQATFTTGDLSVGSQLITATYSGATGFGGSSGTLEQSVLPTPTSTVLSSSLTPSVLGNPVTFTAIVTAGSGATPTGSVQFADGGTPLGSSVPLAADGSATLTTSSLAVGPHAITATYLGASAFGISSAGVQQVVLGPVVADAGGPYSAAEGEGVTLDGSGSTPGATLEWDLDGDGDFSDASGPSPTLTWSQLQALGINDGPSAHRVALRATLGAQQATDTTELDLLNTGPETIVEGALTATAGEPFTVKVGADDPSPSDMAALFTYTIDWGDGSPAEQVVGPADPPATHTYVAAGAYTASLSSTDKDGGTGATLSIVVVVAAAPVTPPTAPPTTPPTGSSAGSSGGGLPATGADPRAAALLAGLLLFAGAAAVHIARRRAQRG
ncbi:Ig-like domain-containing protein [Microbacterium sp. BK668]|nr:Ig-like domain-containing protein [Microbacterium sp. BK668]